MDHELRPRDNTVILKPMTPPMALKPGRKPRGGGSSVRAEPVKTVQIIRKVEYSSSIQERDADSHSGNSTDGASVDGGETGKKKCILLIVKKNKEEIDVNNNNNSSSVSSPKKRVSNCGSAPPIPKKPRSSAVLRAPSEPRKKAERNMKPRKSNSAPLQSLPELRQLINFHRNKHAELIQENQLYDTNLNIQSLSLPPIKPIPVPPSVDSNPSCSLKDSHNSNKFQFKQPLKTPPLTPKFSGIFKLSDNEDLPNFFSKRGGMLGLKHFKPPVTVAKTPLGQLLAFSRQETQLKVPEVWPLPQNPPPPSHHHLSPISSRITNNFILPPAPRVLFGPDDSASVKENVPARSSCGILWTDGSTKENIPRARNPSSEPQGILWSDDKACPLTPPKSSIFQIDLPSMLDYQNLTILGDNGGFHSDEVGDSWRLRFEEEEGSRAKRVLEDYDLLLNSPDPICDPIEIGYSPANPDFDFKSLEIEARRDPEAIWAEEMQSVGAPSQDYFYDEIYEYLRNEVFDPFKQPYLVSTNPFQDVHGSKVGTYRFYVFHPLFFI